MSIFLNSDAENYTAQFSPGLRELTWPKTTILHKNGAASDSARLKPHKVEPWTGEGLPPVGTVCRLSFSGHDQGIVTVNYITPEFCVCKSHDYGHEQGSPTRNYTFSLIFTPEQIALEEHRKEVEQLAADTDWILPKEACEAVLAAGYRKSSSK